MSIVCVFIPLVLYKLYTYCMYLCVKMSRYKLSSHVHMVVSSRYGVSRDNNIEAEAVDITSDLDEWGGVPGKKT